MLRFRPHLGQILISWCTVPSLLFIIIEAIPHPSRKEPTIRELAARNNPTRGTILNSKPMTINAAPTPTLIVGYLTAINYENQKYESRYNKPFNPLNRHRYNIATTFS
jgi:hypothetical protein